MYRKEERCAKGYAVGAPTTATLPSFDCVVEMRCYLLFITSAFCILLASFHVGDHIMPSATVNYLGIYPASITLDLEDITFAFDPNQYGGIYIEVERVPDGEGATRLLHADVPRPYCTVDLGMLIGMQYGMAPPDFWIPGTYSVRLFSTPPSIEELLTLFPIYAEGQAPPPEWNVSAVATPAGERVTISGGTDDDYTTYALGEALQSEGRVYSVEVEGLGYIILEDVGQQQGGPYPWAVRINNDQLWYYDKGKGELGIIVHDDLSFAVAQAYTNIASTSGAGQNRVDGQLLGIEPEPNRTPITTLIFKVKTASSGGGIVDGPGTDSTVYLHIGDPHGTYPRWELDKPRHNDMEPGKWDTYDLKPHGLCLEDLKQFELRIEKWNMGPDDSWKVAKIIITANQQIVYENDDVDAWLQTPATADQTYTDTIEPLGVLLGRQYDQCCFLCAHNAFANWPDGWFYEQQSQTVKSQLEEGVRSFMLDTHTVNNEVVLLHESEAASHAMTLGMYLLSGWKKFSETLNVIENFLLENRSEVITLILESYVEDPALMQAALDAGGVSHRVFYANRPNVGSQGQSWNVSTDGWPTLEWMKTNQKNLVILSDQNGADGLPHTWSYAVENNYGDDSLTLPTALQHRKGSKALSNTNRCLYIFNHFPTGSVGSTPIAQDFVWSGLRYGYDGTGGYNDSNTMLDFIQQGLETSGRLPNFVAVNFVEAGANGGAQRVVREVNNLWQSRNSYCSNPS